MRPAFEQSLQAIDQATLTSLVRRALNSDSVQVIDWSYQQIYAGFEVKAGVYRFAGNGRDQGRTVPWSLILKVIHVPVDEDDLSDWNYLKRELLAYQSGLLEDLPGDLTVPRCFGIIERSSDESWMWLEEITDEVSSEWPLDRYGLAARHLGQFNAAYLVGQPLPTHPWLSTRWLHSLLSQAAPSIASLSSVLEHPLLRRLYPTDVAEGVLHLWTKRELFLDMLGHLPQTFCHRDAFRRNLFARRDAGGRDRTVAIDWVFAGTGAVGEELVALVVATLGFREVDLDQARELEEVVFDGYLKGLREAGWQGDPRLVRFAYTAASPLRYCLGGTMNLLPILLDESRHARLEQMWGDPVETFVDYWANMFRFLLNLADEARGLLDTLQ